MNVMSDRRYSDQLTEKERTERERVMRIPDPYERQREICKHLELWIKGY